MKIFGREPTLWLSLIYALITLVGTVGLRGLSGEQSGLWIAAISAAFLAINAYAVRPISPVAFTYAIAAVIALIGSYGYHLPDATVAAINAGVVPILALLSRDQVSPKPTAISKA